MDKKDYGDDVDEKVEIEELRKGIIAHCNFSILAFKGVYSIFCGVDFTNLILSSDLNLRQHYDVDLFCI